MSAVEISELATIQEMKDYCRCGGTVSYSIAILLKHQVGILITSTCNQCHDKRFTQVPLYDVVEHYLKGRYRTSWRSYKGDKNKENCDSENGGKE